MATVFKPPIRATPFAHLFRLADPRRVSFELSPEHDAALFIDLDGVVGWIEKRIAAPERAPQLVVTGDFGTGKSHVLRLIEKKLAPARKIRPVYFQLGPFQRRSSFLDLHISVMEELLEILEQNLTHLEEVPSFLEQKTSVKGDVKAALVALARPDTPEPKRAMLRSWLRGTGPTPTQARKDLELSGRLFEGASPITLVNLWKAVGELQRKADGRSLMLLMDEGEAFSKMVSPDSQASMGAGLRTLFDPDNRSLGIGLGLNTPTSRQGLHPMLQHDVASRIQGKQLQLSPLVDPVRIRRFLEGLWERLRGPKAPPELFDEGATDLLSNHLRTLRDSISLRSQTLSPTPTQRDLMSVLRYIGEFAMRDGELPPLTREMLDRWFPARSG